MIPLYVRLKKLFKYFYFFYYNFFLFYLDKFFILFIKTKGKKSLLIIKIDKLGDYILWDNCLQNTLKIKKTLSLICSPEVYSYLKIHYPKINLIVCHKFKFLFNLIYRYKFLKKIAKYHYSEILDAKRESEVFFEGSIIRNLYGQKIAYNNKGNFFNKNFYNKLIYIQEKKIFHEQDFNDLFFSKFLKKKITNYPLKFLRYKKYNKYKDSLLLSVGGSDIKKTVNPELMLRFIEKKNVHNKIIVCGSENDQKYFDNTFKFFGGNFTNLLGHTTFDEFVYLHSISAKILSNDSSSGHLAHKLHKNSITFLGGGHFKRFFPYPKKNQKHKYIFKKMKCFNCSWNCTQKFLINGKYPCIANINNI